METSDIIVPTKLVLFKFRFKKMGRGVDAAAWQPLL